MKFLVDAREERARAEGLRPQAGQHPRRDPVGLRARPAADAGDAVDRGHQRPPEPVGRCGDRARARVGPLRIRLRGDRRGWQVGHVPHEAQGRREGGLAHLHDGGRREGGLKGKQGPWTNYPKRMLQMRARSWCLRDVYPDVLRGVHVAEEAQDMPEKDVTPAASVPWSSSRKRARRSLRRSTRRKSKPSASHPGRYATTETVTEKPPADRRGIERPSQCPASRCSRASCAS
jgi:hypothetical protein